MTPHGAPPVEAVAIVVTDSVTPYLHTTLEALAAQTRTPACAVVVDVSSPPAGGEGPGPRDPLGDLLADTGLDRAVPVRVLRAAGAATFGAAVEAAVAALRPAAGPVRAGEETAAARWLWLLHDDSAPAADALALLCAAAEDPGLGVAGCTQRGWVQPDQLLEVGLTATRSGRRGVEFDADEIDQGQHGERSAVLAVGTAGMFVDERVWREVEGFDPRLGPFGDGLEFCRRVRRAGHDVRVVPAAVVHHARAGLTGLRGRAAHQTPDARRSYRARRAAQLHNAAVATRGPWRLLLVAMALLAVPRALVRLVAKDAHLAAAELGAGLDALRGGRAVAASRRRVDRVAAVGPEALTRYETTAARIRADRREARRHRRAVATMRSAPSELEIAERAALARSRRRWLLVLVLALLLIGLVLSGHLLGGLPAGAAIAALPATLGELWQAARSSWVATGVGAAGPADPLLSVLSVIALPLALIGVPPSTTLALVLVLGPPAAGVGAWYAAGAATRRGATRAWVAVLWALSPTVLVALTEGRVGVVLAAAALPWVALSVAWTAGARRRDLLLPGLVGARRRRRRPTPGPEGPQRAPRRELRVFADLLEDGEETADLVPGARPASRVGGSTVADEAALADLAVAPPARDDAIDESQFEVAFESYDAAPARHGSGRNVSYSLMAAAGGGLALAIATAGVPALLPVALLAVVALCAVVPHGRRFLLLLPLPALALHLPVLVAVVRGGDPRALFADTGPLLHTDPATGLQALLGFAEDPDAVHRLRESAVVEAAGVDVSLLLQVGAAALVVLAAVALLCGAGATRATRGAWLLVVLGVVAHAVTTRVVVGLGATVDGTAALVAGWGGAGTLLVTLGLLTAVAAADGEAYERQGRRALVAASRRDTEAAGAGVRAGRVVAGAAAVLLALLPLGAALGQVVLVATAPERTPTVRGTVVPALSQQVAAGPERARTLALSLADDTLRVGLWRGDGERLDEASTLVAARRGEVAAGGGRDPLGAAVVSTAAHLAGGGGTDLAARLGELGVGVVLVPPAGGSATGEAAPATVRERDDLVARIDAVAGLERVTVNEAGTVWRVASTTAPATDDPAGTGDARTTGEPPVSTARARITDPAGTPLADLPAGTVDVEARVPATEDGGERLVVLAERADERWRARFTTETGGTALEPRTLEDGRQAFVLPPEAGWVRVTHTAFAHGPIGLLQILVLGGTALAAVPVRRGGIDS